MGKIANFFKNLFGRKGEIDEDFYDELETVLLVADVGIEKTQEILEQLKSVVKKQKIKTIEEGKGALKEILVSMLSFEKKNFTSPTVITVVGVNGVGKTTAIGKMASYFKGKGKKVLLAAGDTFRAAASAQLNEWADRAKVRIVKHQEGADPGAVVFDAIASAKSKGDDILIVDTAGRLHNNVNLMNELKKIGKIIDREWSDANKEVFIVLDASIGQNSLVQAQLFKEIVPISGIILTKLDGTSKGGVVFQIEEKLNIPIVFVGVGEGIDDLKEFDAKEFVENLF